MNSRISSQEQSLHTQAGRGWPTLKSKSHSLARKHSLLPLMEYIKFRLSQICLSPPQGKRHSQLASYNWKCTSKYFKFEQWIIASKRKPYFPTDDIEALQLFAICPIMLTIRYETYVRDIFWVFRAYLGADAFRCGLLSASMRSSFGRCSGLVATSWFASSWQTSFIKNTHQNQCLTG